MKKKTKNKLKGLRKRKHITQKQLAQALNSTSDYVSIIERGMQTPGFMLAKKIADYFEESVDSFFLVLNRAKHSTIKPNPPPEEVLP